MKATSIFVPQSRLKSIVFSFAVVTVLSVSATRVSAEEIQTIEVEKQDAERFQMIREDGIIIRMDKKTGAMSTCKLKGSSLICRMAADERATMETEIASLQEQLDKIPEERSEKDILEEPESEGDKSGENEIAKNEKKNETFDQELDKMVDLSSKVLRRFFTVMKELRDDFAEENSAK